MKRFPVLHATQQGTNQTFMFSKASLHERERGNLSGLPFKMKTDKIQLKSFAFLLAECILKHLDMILILGRKKMSWYGIPRMVTHYNQLTPFIFSPLQRLYTNNSGFLSVHLL